MDKNWSFVPKNSHLVWKKQNNCNFYTKNEVFAKKFDQNVQILDKYWSFVPINVHLVPKKQKICTFYTKNEVFAKQFDQNVQIMDKNWSFVPKMYIWSRKMERFVLFTQKLKFCPKISPDCTHLG